jgi:hypothetical protein
VALFVIADHGPETRVPERNTALPATDSVAAGETARALEQITRAEGAQGLATAAFRMSDGGMVLLDRSGPVPTLLYADTGEARLLRQEYGSVADLLLADASDVEVVLRLTGRGNAILYDDAASLGRPLDRVDRRAGLAADAHAGEDRG